MGETVTNFSKGSFFQYPNAVLGYVMTRAAVNATVMINFANLMVLTAQLIPLHKPVVSWAHSLLRYQAKALLWTHLVAQVLH